MSTKIRFILSIAAFAAATLSAATMRDVDKRLRQDQDLVGARKMAAEIASTSTDAREVKSAEAWLKQWADEPDFGPQLAYAHQEFTNWVFRISGKMPDMSKVVMGMPSTSPEVAEFAKRHADDFAKLDGNDGFIIAEEGGFLGLGSKTVFIVASKAKGVLNGVYRYLEKNSDIIWVRPFESDKEGGIGTIFTKDPDFRNTVKYLCDVPSVSPERFWSGFHDGNDAKHQARLLNSACVWQNTGYEVGTQYGDSSYYMASIGGFHLLDKYRETNPEVFVLKPDGTRDKAADHNACFTNPKTLELLYNEAEKLVAANPKKVKYYTTGHADGWTLCQCEQCMKPITLPDGKTVLPTDSNFRSTQYAMLINALSERLRKKFPWIDPLPTDGYIFTAEAPAVPVPGGCMNYCPYIKNHKKPVYDEVVNSTWKRKAEGFYAAGVPPRGVYEYYLCWTTPLFFHAVCEVAQKDFQWYLKLGGKTFKKIYLDVNSGDNGKSDNPNNTCPRIRDISAIEYWTMSRVMWDANCDVTEMRHEFCRRAYHEAAPIMIEYYDRLAKNYNEDVAGCFWNDDPVNAAKHYICEKEGMEKFVRDHLDRAFEAAVDPRCKELIRRHRELMYEHIDKALKAPKKTTYVVKQITEGTPDFDLEGDYWKKIEYVSPLTGVSQPEVARTNHFVKVVHDRTKFIILVVSKVQRMRDMYEKFAAKGDIDRPMKPGEAFEWDTACEIYFDGRLAQAGGYYMFSNMFNGWKWAGLGSTEIKEPVDWSVKMKPIDGGLALLYEFPFDTIGVDISKGNRVGAQFILNGKPDASWNGGQWHAPTSFQTLFLEMK